MNIADRIQYLRKASGLSQEELADQIGVSRQAISKWESAQSLPEIDKVIALSTFFEVTTDYILTGAEPERAASVKKTRPALNANIFVHFPTVLNFIGLIVSSAIWYEEQRPMAIVAGLILMAVGCMFFGVGLIHSTQNVAKAKRSFWTINIWILSFIPLSLLYNALFSFTLAPYPLLNYGSLIALPIFGLVYLAIGFGVIFALRPRRKTND